MNESMSHNLHDNDNRYSRYREIDDDSDVENKMSKAREMPAYFIMVLAFLTPIIFISTSIVGFQALKTFSFITLTLFALGFWIFVRLRRDTFKLPNNLLTLSAFLVPLLYLITSIFSPNVHVSILGRAFEMDTALMIVTFFILFGLVASVFQDLSKTFKLYSVIFISFLLVAIFHILRIIFFASMPTFGIFNQVTDNSVGKWNDIAVFAALVLVMVLTTIESIKADKRFKVIQFSTLVLAIILLIIINFSLAWYLVGIFSLLFFVYFLSINRSQETQSGKLPVTSLVILLLSFFFIISANTFGPFVSNLFNINYSEIRPSWGGTFEVLKETLVNDPVVGVGAGRFDSAWQDYKPADVNRTDYWAVDFRYGVGFIPSSLATVGIPGFLAWMFFFVVLLSLGFKALFKETIGGVASRFILVSSFIASLYMWVVMFAYIPSVTTMVLTFIFTGIFAGSLYREGMLSVKEIDLKNNAKFGFLYVFVLVVILVGLVAYEFDAVKRFASNHYFQKANYALNVEGNVDLTESYLRQALAFHQNDTYLRSLVEMNRAKINQILISDNVDQTTAAVQVRNALSIAVSAGQAAIQYDDTNYLNHMSLGNIYQALVPLNVDGAYEQSRFSYEMAREINPNNPSIDLALARLELANQDVVSAREEITKALQKKIDYTDAIFLLAQIDVSEGRINEAISNVEAAAVIRPNDPVVFFQLGLLRYNNRNFDLALSALERAVILNPFYANAKYFLGLSYDRVGRSEEAIGQFEDLEFLNPGNEEVKLILDNLRSGLDPFTGAEPPIDSTPESREELPLEDGDPEVEVGGQ